jgi:hypothetical protein
LRYAGEVSTHSRVEDWEQFFQEKSQRRAEKVRGRSSKRWMRRAIAAWIFLLIVVVAMLVVYR